MTATVELAKSCDYGIRGLLYLAQQPDPFAPVLLRDIARHANAPEAYLSKVFQGLRASNLVRSHRGRHRGYSLARQPQELSLYDVIVALEGPASLRSVHLPTGRGGDGDPLERAWGEIEEKVIETMKHATLWTILTKQPPGRT